MPADDSIPTEEEITIQLRRVLTARRFSANQNSAKFLALVVGKAIRGEPIRQAIIGSELFPDKYAKNDITDVRVTANKLRKILAEYFEQEGKDDPVIIALPRPPGPNEPKLPEGKAYRPIFSHNHRNAAVGDYLKGSFHLWQADPESDLLAMRHFNEAIARERNYAAPYIAKADLLLRWAIYGGWGQSAHGYGPKSVKQCLRDADRLARMALRNDPNAWRGHAVSGAIYACRYRWTEARKCFDAALQLNSHETRHASWYYAAYLLAAGEADDAMRIVKSRSAQNPNDPIALTIYGCFLYATGRFTHASLALSQAGNMDQRDWISALALAQVLLTIGDAEGALLVIGAPSTPNPWRGRRRLLAPLFSGLQILCLARAGKKKEALAQLRWAEKGDTPPLQLALAYMGLEETDKAIAALSKAHADRYPLMLWLNQWPIFDPLREHPKFRTLVAKVTVPSQG